MRSARSPAAEQAPGVARLFRRDVRPRGDDNTNRSSPGTPGEDVGAALAALSLAASRLSQRSVPVAFLGEVAGGT